MHSLIVAREGVVVIRQSSSGLAFLTRFREHRLENIKRKDGMALYLS